MKCKLQFVITGLGGGGAERMLLKLLSEIDRDVFEPGVISLTQHGDLTKALCERFRQIDVPVRLLGMRAGVPDPRGVWRLAGWLREAAPDLVNTWMYHADLIGGIAAKLAGNLPVVWNIRHSNLHPDSNKKTTIMTAKACAAISRYLPRKIICCAEVAEKVHVEIGYDRSKMTVIPNGFDIKAFKPDPEAKHSLCSELGIPFESPIVGLVARFDPLKDHRNFIDAAKILTSRVDNARFVLCGDGITPENTELLQRIDAKGLSRACHLLGHRTDVPHLNAAFDVASSSSCGEGFSNTIGEAMACAVPCVATDVGDSAFIVGSTGRVVPARNPEALANGWQELLDMPMEERARLGQEARQRVLENFSLDRVARRYELLFCEALGR